jgi:hypothetical protein
MIYPPCVKQFCNNMLYTLGQEDLAPTDRGGSRVKRPLSPVSLSFSGAVDMASLFLDYGSLMMQERARESFVLHVHLLLSIVL